MSRPADADEGEKQRPVFHLVCHDCPTEAVARGEREAQERLSKHRSETGHNVELAPIASVEGE